jgi:cell division protein FtsI/penicillin-binding protein 2
MSHTPKGVQQPARAGALVASLVLLLIVSSACASIGGKSDAQQLAERLAAALKAHDVARLPLTSESDRPDLDFAVRDMAGASTVVNVRNVQQNGDRASVELAWRWDLDRSTWRYETRAELREADDRWKVVWSPSMLAPGLREGEQLAVVESAARRGDIRGRKGAPIVIPRPVVRFGLDKAAVPTRRWDSSATRIARSLGIEPAAYRQEVRAYGAKALVEAIALRAKDASAHNDASYRAIPGAVAINDTMPLAPSRDFAGPLLGSVGAATAEIIARSGGATHEGDQVGLSGLQARYDQQLRGSPGVRVEAVDRDGTKRTLFQRAAKRGRDLRTTLDPALQRKAEEALADHVGPRGPGSALVAIRPSTGAVLAAADGAGNAGLNLATAGQVAPGSTFKVVSALALLRKGLTPTMKGPCPATTVVDGRRFKNYDDYPSDRLGSIDLTTAVANSCNTFFINSRNKLSGDDLAQAGASLGLGVDHDLGFPAYLGQAPPAVGRTEKAADMIGQGKVLASPLAMATVAASVVAGHRVIPTLLSTRRPNAAPPAHPLTNVEARQLRSLMRAVVTQGSARFLLDLPGQVGAKTGTAEYGQPTADGTLKTHTWMIATQGDLAVAVYVETGESGSQTAGPILDQFLS